ncbi:hypothetical protein HZS_4701 [Henneguya salminicola]|nr:hypothetical protein HZS_4701 [Henneguya salminicola]
MSNSLKALIVGCFSGSGKSFILSPIGKTLDSKVGGKLTEALKSSNFDGKLKKIRQFYHLSPQFNLVVVAGLGDEHIRCCPIEEIDIKLENIRNAIFRAIRVCEENEISDISVDDCTESKCFYLFLYLIGVGEISALSYHEVGQWKSDYKPKSMKIGLFSSQPDSLAMFEEGIIQGEAQTFAATLAETPANLKTPTKIAALISSKMPCTVTCITRDKNWIKSQQMEMFLSVNQGSAEPPVLLETHYKGSEDPPIVLVGKGITFDSGGISIKPSAAMADMKADMQGAATVFATIRALALLKIPIHVIGIAPFTENLPSGTATKPGDVFRSMCGKTVEVDNTDAEGRLVLGDALTYAATFHPSQIIDLATLTGAVGVALGSAACAIYTKSPKILEDFKQVSITTGDRVWHMPLYKEYSKMIESKVADLINSTKKREAGSCTAAAFLSEFVTTKEWAHLDIAGVMCTDKEMMCYCPGGMSGRPTRTLIEYVKRQIKETK